MVNEEWRWQDGSGYNGSVESALVTDGDGSVVFAGWTSRNRSGSLHSNDSTSSNILAMSMDATGLEQSRWQIRVHGVHDAANVAIGGGGGTILLAGRTAGAIAGDDDRGDSDFIAVKLDASGGEVWTWEDGTAGFDEIKTAVSGPNRTTILAGTTEGDWAGSSSNHSDFIAVKLDADGSETWRWQGGTEEVDGIEAMSMGEDGAVLLAGWTRGNWDRSSAGRGIDFAAVKLDSDGMELWRWQDGTDGDDVITAAVGLFDGTLLLAGYTAGHWNGTNAGGADFAAVKLDGRGSVLWTWQDGTAGNDTIATACERGDSTVLLAGSTTGSWDQDATVLRSAVAAPSKDFAAVKIDANGTELWRWQDGTNEDEEVKAVVGVYDSVLLAGYTFGRWKGTRHGSQSLAALRLHDHQAAALAHAATDLFSPSISLLAAAIAVAFVAVVTIVVAYPVHRRRQRLRRAMNGAVFSFHGISKTGRVRVAGRAAAASNAASRVRPSMKRPHVHRGGELLPAISDLRGSSALDSIREHGPESADSKGP